LIQFTVRVILGWSLTRDYMPLSIFLCHSVGDKQRVRELYRRLQSAGYRPWLDEENLLPGQDWEYEIVNAVRAADIALVCLSTASVNKTGFVQKELRFALDVAEEQPEGRIFLIPVKLEECDLPIRLKRWHWVNLFEENGFEKLLRSLQQRAASVDAETAPAATPTQGDATTGSAEPSEAPQQLLVQSWSILGKRYDWTVFQSIVSQETRIDRAKIVPGASFSDDLGLDSLDMIELAMAFEEAFLFEIPDDEAAMNEIRTAEEAFRYLLKFAE
jgi:acyl carrier protein